MESSFIFLGIGTVGKAVAHGHVRAVFQNGAAERMRRLGGVRVVPVDHEVAVGLDVAEHLADDVALALPGLESHHCAVGAGDFGGVVRGVVVVDVYRCPGKLPAKIVHDLCDGDRLVIAGYENGYFIRH